MLTRSVLQCAIALLMLSDSESKTMMSSSKSKKSMCNETIIEVEEGTDGGRSDD